MHKDWDPKQKIGVLKMPPFNFCAFVLLTLNDIWAFSEKVSLLNFDSNGVKNVFLHDPGLRDPIGYGPYRLQV